MNKWFWVVLLVVVLPVAAAFIFIPGTLVISEASMVHSSINGAYRVISNKDVWKKPQSDVNKGYPPSPLHADCNEYKFQLSKKTYNAVQITVVTGEQSLETRLILLQLPSDSIALKWTTSFRTSNNPVKRF